MPRLSALFTPLDARLGLLRCDTQKTRWVETIRSHRQHQEKPSNPWRRYGPSFCYPGQVLGSKALMSLEELLLLERLPVMFSWQRGPEAVRIIS